MRVDEMIKEAFVGKKLIALEFGANYDDGSRDVKFGQLIKNI